MTPAEFFPKSQLKVEVIVRLNQLQSVRDESSRVQGFTNKMQEVSQLLPNKIWKQLDQYSNWKIISTKTSAEFSSKNQLNAEYNLILS